MSLRHGVTLAICTRNRLDDLLRCIASVIRQAPDFPVEVLLIDDGDMPEPLIASLRRELGHPPFRFAYRRKQQPGLLLSRIEAVRLASCDYVLFVDDDAELEDGYLARLAETYDRHPDAAGIGGIDAALRGSFKWDLFTRLILYDSGRPGRLSPSGCGGSMTRWSAQSEPFPSEYVLGCNMSFRKSALAGLPHAEWLTGYSLGEDLYLAAWARRTGEIWIDPRLRVRHHHARTARDKEAAVAYTEVANHYHLLRWRGAAAWRFGALLWTSFGLLGRSLVKRSLRGKASGYARGIRFVLAEDWRRLFRESISDLGDGGTLRRGGGVPGEAGPANAQGLRADPGRPERRRAAPSADSEV
ncbi:glycosyltransferase family 2 protein [Cohnella nanjingensis]|uniref:glycosyltransferase family 2 protein n=1 Tax=Cohnella nanjingensis TaxID=1387779 RepID=UPI001C87C932|nr:glycosyltransferase family 2 protein [Cohnella nanjingensis]